MGGTEKTSGSDDAQDQGQETVAQPDRVISVLRDADGMAWPRPDAG